ncbi:hypothetical protein HDU96_009633 [Phlyctochytrium bullatum]|nr:hypothetical protein HDU96_009633 [Phlyctochytrium bullatum]
MPDGEAGLVKPDILKLSPIAFVDLLRQNGIKAFHIYYDDGKVKASHPLLQPIGNYFLAENDDFEEHEGIFVQIGEKSGTLQGAFVHRTCRGAGAGGVRNWAYDNVEGFLRDGIRLAKGMCHKNALAGIWWGGGKGVMARNTGKGLMPQDDPADRKIAYEEYGEFMSVLKGCYVTAEDLGSTEQDMLHIYSKTRHTTCIPVALGGSGNPSVPTARGIVKGLEAAFAFLGKTLKGGSVAVQGIGHVGSALIHFLFEHGVARIVASDVAKHREASIRDEFAKYGDKFSFRIVATTDMSILFEDVDAVSPCATGAVLNNDTIPKIKAKIVCGAANNQLLDIKKHDKFLKERDIVYIPDFLCNRMGIVNCADEHTGLMEDDPKIEMHLGKTWENSIYNLSLKVLKDAKESGKTTQEIAVALADERSRIVNPLYGHRGKDIIRSLVTKDAHWRKLVGLAK